MNGVRVYCRMRPFNKRELALGGLSYPITVTPHDIIIADKKKQYAFDYNFDDKATQEQVFNVIGRAVVTDFFDGFNATQFVYGQTGAGKSWTMMGLKDNEELSGMIPRTSALIFQKIEDQASGWKFEIEASYMEIYMERINDLLDPEKQNLEVKEQKDRGVFVPGLSVESVGALEDIYDIIDRGDKVRKVAATKMNAGSSRSHSVLSIFIVQTPPEGGKISSQLNLVDLAGSERSDKTGATGDVLKQGATINLSLTVLSQVISGLSDLAELPPGKTPPVIPYRSSKLTRLLQTSLGGNAKTGLSVHVSPHVDNIEESISTLDFGKRAKKIKNNAKAIVHRSAEQLEKDLDTLKDAHEKLQLAFQALSAGKPVQQHPTTTTTTTEVGGVAADSTTTTELTNQIREHQDRIQELELEQEQSRVENDNLKSEIGRLEEQLQGRVKNLDGLQRDLEVRDLEVKALQTRIKEIEAKPVGVTGAVTPRQVPGSLTRSQVGFSMTATATESVQVIELKELVDKQKDMLNKVQSENKDLRQENTELADRLEESTRRLAIAELQVMRYESARSKSKDKKIAIKIASGKGKPSPVWRNLLSIAPQTQRSANATRSDCPVVDYETRRQGTLLERFGGLHPIPPSEITSNIRQGMLEERMYQKTSFIRRWCVLRDSFLLCYDSESSPSTEPQFCIPLADSKIGSCPKQGEYEFCFMVLCGTYFSVMAVGTDNEKVVWLKDLSNAKFVTQTNLMRTAYFNRCAINAVHDPVELDALKSRFQQCAYAAMGEAEFVHGVSDVGGLEGFLLSPGFKHPDLGGLSVRGDPRKEWRSHHVIVRDSLLLVYDLANHSELVTEPRGVMYLGTSAVSIVKQHEESENPDDPSDNTLVRFYFAAISRENEFEAISLCATSEEERARWIAALSAATKVTSKNILMAELDKESISVLADIPAQGKDLQDRPLDPLCVQPYDENQKPFYRHPAGYTTTRDMIPIALETPRLSQIGQSLDFYNRPLPSLAVPMFAKDPVESIGVGVDGIHYAYPSGREFTANDPHFDANGQQLSLEVVVAAESIVPALKKACIARSAQLIRDKAPLYDAFGRVLRKNRKGKLLTLEGKELGAKTAVFDGFGNRTKYSPPALGVFKSLEIVLQTNDAKVQVLGKVEVEVGCTTLADVSDCTKKLASSRIAVITFLNKGVPLADSELTFRLASDYLPRLQVSCRDANGKRFQRADSEDVFQIKINHDQIDEDRVKSLENDFIKVVSGQKKGARPVSSRSFASPSPRTSRTARP